MRQILVTLLTSGALCTAPAIHAEYPAKTVKVIVPFSPGAINDTLARMVSEKLAASLGRPVVVENRPGAGSQIGTAFVARAAPTGETLLFGAADGISVLPAIKKSPGYAVPDSFTFIGRVGTGAFALIVNANLPVNSLEEFVRYAAANPKAVRHGTAGNGSVTHLGSAFIEQTARIQLTQVHYQGMAGAVNDLVAGHIDAALVTPATIAPHLKGGKLKALAVMGPNRHPLLPGTPSAAEVGYKDLNVIGWWGIVGPSGLSREVTNQLTTEVADILKTTAFRGQLEERGIEVSPLAGPAFKAYVESDLAHWKSIAQRAQISLD